MNENKEILEEELTRLDESVEEKLTEENSVDESTLLENDEDNEEAIVATKKLKKHDEALILVAKAKQIVKDADEQTEACKLLLAGDLKEYEEAKVSLKSRGMDACTLLIEKLEDEDDDSTSIEEEEQIAIFEPKEELDPMYLKDVSSGKFTGFIYSLLGGVATVAGLGFYAMQKLGIPLNLSKVPSTETLQSILGWFGAQVGRPDDAMNGGLIVGGAALVVMALIYMIRVSLKGSKNLHFATKQLENAEAYTEQKSNCKTEMDRVDAHMKETLEALKMYEVLFNEQKGKLERILYIEGAKDNETPYHTKTLIEIDSTKELLRTIKRFMSTPMSEEGKLSEKSVISLERVQNKIDEMLERLYQ